MDNIAAIILLIGVLLNINKRPFCWVLLSIANLLWLILALLEESGLSSGILIQSIGLFFINIYGYIEWRNNEIYRQE